MKKWQRERNYRTVKDGNTAVAYQITVDGVTVEVTKEVYQVYTQMDRRERYQREMDMAFGLLCIPELLDRQAEPAAEDSNAYTEVAHLRSCLLQLSETEQTLIRWRYWAEMTQEEVAQKLHISQQAVSCREQRILRKLKVLLEESYTE